MKTSVFIELNYKRRRSLQMNRKEVCSEILRLVGGEANVKSVSHCATR